MTDDTPGIYDQQQEELEADDLGAPPGFLLDPADNRSPGCTEGDDAPQPEEPTP